MFIVVAWEKNFGLESPIAKNRAVYYYRLQSESSGNSADDTESVYSIQDKETGRTGS